MPNRPLQSNEVFTPGTFPAYTYVERGEEQLEKRLAQALATPGYIVSISGPSKSGKTVLVEKVVGPDNLITVVGANIDHPNDLWQQILSEMDIPGQVTKTQQSSTGIVGGGEVSGTTGVPFVAKGSVKGKVEANISDSTSQTQSHTRGGLNQVVREIGDSDFVILIDDFHYMPRPVQGEVAKQIKEGARRGLSIITAAVPHRSDDVVRANPELRGRVMSIDLAYWQPEHLLEIAQTGFELLGYELTPNIYKAFVREAAGSPQLMQVICLSACLEVGVDLAETTLLGVELQRETVDKVFKLTSQVTNFRSLVDVMDSGPRVRGQDRQIYTFVDGTEGDVYRSVLKAISASPPELSLSYENLYARIRSICVGRFPTGSATSTACAKIASLAATSFAKERPIDWDNEKSTLDITDPYLLFYMRWSGRLQEPER